MHGQNHFKFLLIFRTGVAQSSDLGPQVPQTLNVPSPLFKKPRCPVSRL